MTKLGGRLILILSLLQPVWAPAHTMRLDRAVSTRASQGTSAVLHVSGSLAAGAVVRVPEDVATRFREDSEVQLMKWLGTNGELREFSVNNQIKRDYFFPVEVVEPGNSVGVKAGDQVYISIRFLARRQALHFVVEKNTPAVAQAEWEEKKPLFENLKRDLASTLSQVEKKNRNTIANRRSARRGVVRFDSNCTVNFENFQPEIERVAGEQRIPEDLLLSIMHLESGFRCQALRREFDGSHSVGLFQINTRSTNVPLCDTVQLQSLKAMTTIEDLKVSDVRCLQNPLVNLEEAARLLREKYAAVNSRKQPPAGEWQDLSRQERDSWRLALAAYNGGEAYVYQAYFDIQDYNQRHGADLDPQDWETRRVFLLRRTLDRQTQDAYFQNEMRYRRGFKNILINMSYVESMVGREEVEQGPRPLIAQWASDPETVTR